MTSPIQSSVPMRIARTSSLLILSRERKTLLPTCHTMISGFSQLYNTWQTPGIPHHTLSWLKREWKALTYTRSNRQWMLVSWLNIPSGVWLPTFEKSGHMGKEDTPSSQEEPNTFLRERRSTAFHQIAAMGTKRCRLSPDIACRTATSKPIRTVHGWKTGGSNERSKRCL